MNTSTDDFQGVHSIFKQYSIYICVCVCVCVCVCMCVCVYLAALQGMWDLCSPTRDRTHTPCSGNAES